MAEALAKILCVDDEPFLLAALSRSLRGRYAVTTALNAHEALQLMEEAAFDVVVCDLGMPGIDGIELLRRLRARWPQTVRILLTGFGPAVLTERGVEADLIFRCLDKPAPAEVITAALQAAIGPRRTELCDAGLRISPALPM
ncbi:MAG TPA: response regulator [Rudaea sp.]